MTPIQQLHNGLGDVIKTVMAEVAAHKGWIPPKLKVLAEKVKTQPFVDYVSINQEGIR